MAKNLAELHFAVKQNFVTTLKGGTRFTCPASVGNGESVRPLGICTNPFSMVLVTECIRMIFSIYTQNEIGRRKSPGLGVASQVG
jgi:hypothetical protein